MSAFPQPVPSQPEESQQPQEGTVLGNYPAFFPVGSMKLVLMSICTFGIYEIFWFYKNWQIIRDRDGVSLSPFWRTMFFPIWSFTLFKMIKQKAQSSGISATWSATGLGVAVIVLNAIVRLPDPFWLLAFASFVPLLMVQSTVNDINKKEAPFLDSNEAITGKNLAVLLIGGTLVLLAVIGAFIAPE
jgi:hypothetical protein